MQTAPGPLPAPASSAPLNRLSVSPSPSGGAREGGEDGASSAARGPEVLPSAAAGGSEPPPLPARRGPPTLDRGWGRRFGGRAPSVSLVAPPGVAGEDGGGDTSARLPRGAGVSAPQPSRADGRTPSAWGERAPRPRASLSSPLRGRRAGRLAGVRDARPWCAPAACVAAPRDDKSTQASLPRPRTGGAAATTPSEYDLRSGETTR